MIEQINKLTNKEHVIIKENKSVIDKVVKSLKGNFVITKIGHKECVVIKVEGINNGYEDLYKRMNDLKPFESFEYDDITPNHVRNLVSTYNKKNDRFFKVSTRGGVTRIYEPFEDIQVIDPIKEDEWNEAFRIMLNSKMY